MFEAIAVPLPADEPPGSREGSSGCCVVPLREEQEKNPAAQSHMVVFPKTIAPAFLSLWTRKASLLGI